MYPTISAYIPNRDNPNITIPTIRANAGIRLIFLLLTNKMIFIPKYKPSEIAAINIINVINLLKEISKYNNLDIEKLDFIKSKFLYFLKLNRDTYEILHSCILSASSSIMKNDFEWVKNNIYFIFEEGIDTQYKFAKTCYKIAPNDKFSIDIYFKCDEFYEKNKRKIYCLIV